MMKKNPDDVPTAPLPELAKAPAPAAVPAPPGRSPIHTVRFGRLTVRFNTDTQVFDVLDGGEVVPLASVTMTRADKD